MATTITKLNDSVLIERGGFLAVPRSMEVICNTIISGGGHNPVGIPTYIASTTGQQVTNGQREAVLFIRLKPDSYKANVELRGFSILNATSGDTKIELLFNPTWSGSALTWVDKPFSHLQYAFGAGNNLITDEGLGLESSMFAAANNAVEVVVTSKLRLGKNLQSNANQEGRYDVIALVVNNLSNAQETYQYVLKTLEIL